VRKFYEQFAGQQVVVGFERIAKIEGLTPICYFLQPISVAELTTWRAFCRFIEKLMTTALPTFA
jgi:hypothetical protein